MTYEYPAEAGEQRMRELQRLIFERDDAVRAADERKATILRLSEQLDQVEAEVERLRAFVRKVYDAARLPDYNVLENTTALEWETADLLGLTPDER